MSTIKSTNHCGIDFGTTNSTLSIVQESQPTVIPIDPINTTSPHILKSLIYANPNGQTQVGQKAIDNYTWDLEHIPSKTPQIIFTGRYIKTFGPSSGGGVGPPILVPEIIEVDDSGRGRLLQSLKSVLTSKNYQGTNLFNKFYSLEDLLCLILGQIKSQAENHLGYQLDQVVLGRPVRYVGDPTQEKLALDRLYSVAQKVGFKDVEFEYEPVGAALSFGLDIKVNQTVLVFDFGGGTLDVCIMKFPKKQVLSVSGRPIGGDLVDSSLVQGKLLHHFGSHVLIANKTPLPKHLLYSISQNWYQTSMLKTVKTLGAFEYFIPNADKPQPVINLRDLIVHDLGFKFFFQVDRAKIKLSTESSAIFEFKLPSDSINDVINRSDFEKIITPLVQDSSACINESLHLAQLKADSIDKVILTGGSSKIPLFQKMIIDKFGSDKIINSDPFTSVALGLSLKAQSIFG